MFVVYFITSLLFALTLSSLYLSYQIFQGGVLSLPAVSTQSAGMYTCHASNSEGNVTRVTNVKIKGQLLSGCLSGCCLPVSTPPVIFLSLIDLKPPSFKCLFLRLASCNREVEETPTELRPYLLTY